MDQCKRLIAEFDREVKELEHTDPDTSKILNEREQSMVEEFNYYVGNFNDYLALQKKQYPSNIIRVDLSGGPAEGFEEDNGWLVSSSMTNQQLMDNGHQMMDETDQAIECSKKLVHDVGTETAPAPEDEDKEEEWRKNSRKRKKCNQVKVVKDNMKNGFTKAQIMNGASHILNIMKKYNARPCNPILRTELDQEAKPYIGNTGLRNTLLSRFIDNMIAPGGEFRFRLESIPGGQMYHYWIQGVNEDDSPEITQLKDEIKWLTSEKNELQELGSKILLTLAPVFCDDDEESFKKLPLKEQFVFAQSKLDDLFKDPPADAIPAAYDSLQT
ncbi:uncharacterized protein [Rutidosis leptorrhynchoides]|uniref:uncharacterized protein n=1 Tax=Rutidosis leptorrhynchoides TaxID=125765 RepID=UPI003A999D08